MGLWDSLFEGKNTENINELLSNPTEYIEKADKINKDLEAKLLEQKTEYEAEIENLKVSVDMNKANYDGLDRKYHELKKELKEYKDTMAEVEQDMEAEYQDKSERLERMSDLKIRELKAELEHEYSHDMHCYQEKMFDKLITSFGGMIKLDLRGEVRNECAKE